MKYYVAKRQDPTPKLPLQRYQLKSFPLSGKPEVNTSTFLGGFTKGPTKDSESHFYVSRTLSLSFVASVLAVFDKLPRLGAPWW